MCSNKSGDVQAKMQGLWVVYLRTWVWSSGNREWREEEELILAKVIENLIFIFYYQALQRWKWPSNPDYLKESFIICLKMSRN